MPTSAAHLHLLYEIAMSIGTTLELAPMLQNALATMLKELECSAGGVHLIKRDANEDLHLIEGYSLPQQGWKIRRICLNNGGVEVRQGSLAHLLVEQT
jgi:hypothetical protein